MKSMFVPVALMLAVTQAAAEPLTRSEVISRAANKNPQTAAARAAIDGARARKAEADAARWPKLTLRLGIGPSMRAELVDGTAVQSTESAYEGLGLDDLSVVFGGRLEVIQPLYTFGKIGLRQRAAEAGVRAERARAEMTAAEVAFEAAELYETHLFARDAQRFFEEVIHTLDRSILATRDQLEKNAAGVTEQDLLRLEHARSAARLGLHQARAGVAQSAAGLRAYLDLPAGVAVEVAEPTLEPLSGADQPIEELVATALRRRPELTALTAGAEAYGKLAAAEAAGSRPDFFIMGAVDGAYTPGRDLIETRYVIDPLYHFVPTLIVGFSWTWQGSSSGAKSRQQRAESERLRKLREWARTAMPAEVRVAVREAERARADVAETRTAVNNAKKWLVKASADYNVGLGDSQSLADAVEAYATMRLANLDAIRRFNLAMATLAKATGTLVGDKLSLYPGDRKR